MAIVQRLRDLVEIAHQLRDDPDRLKQAEANVDWLQSKPVLSEMEKLQVTLARIVIEAAKE
jgi:hypothetical protein